MCLHCFLSLLGSTKYGPLDWKCLSGFRLTSWRKHSPGSNMSMENFIDFWNFYDGLVGIFNFIWQNLTLATIDNCKIFEVIPTTKGTDSKQNLFRLIPYRLFHGELVIQDKAQHSSVDFNLSWWGWVILAIKNLHLQFCERSKWLIPKYP